MGCLGPLLGSHPSTSLQPGTPCTVGLGLGTSSSCCSSQGCSR